MDAHKKFLHATRKAATKDNFFPNTYELRRRAFRLASYGCYSKKDLLRLLGCKTRSYHNFLTLCETTLPEEHYQPTQHKRHRRPAFRGDSYEGNENFLAVTYRLKSLTEREIFFYIHLLRILSDLPKKKDTYTSARDLDIPLLESGSVYAKSTLADGLDERAISTYLQQLAACGLVKKISGKRPAQYAPADDPFANLSKEEAEALLFAVDYFKNTAFLSVPGYFLADTLCRRFSINADRNQPFLFTNMDIRRILDDDVVYQILCAIESGHSLHVRWHHKPRNSSIYTDTWLDLHPLAIVEEEQGDGRRQLLALFPDAHKTKPTPHKLRIEEIRDLHAFIPECEIPAPHIVPERRNEIRLRLCGQSAAEEDALMNRLRRELPDVTVDAEGMHPVCCSFVCGDPKKYLPILRTFLPDIEILPAPKAFLHKEMRRNIAETLSLYEGHGAQEETIIRERKKTTDAAAREAGAPRPKKDNLLHVTMFQEAHSAVFRWLTAAYNTLCDTEASPTLQDLLKTAPNHRGEDHSALFSLYLMAAFDFTLSKRAEQEVQKNPAYELKRSDWVVVPPKKRLPILPTALELRWLKTVLHAPEADVFLAPALKEKLLAALADIKAFDLSAWKRQRNRKDVKDRPVLHEPLKRIVHSLHVRQSIRLNGVRHAPLRLSQNMSTGIYHLVCCNLQDNTICTLSEEQFSACDTDTMLLSQEEAVAADAWMLYAPSHRADADRPDRPHVTIAFRNRFNARERAYAMFSSFDKKAFIEQDGNYHLTVFYRPFEEEDVLRRILSFGAYVTVLEPTTIRNEIVHRLRKAQKLYQREYGDPPQEPA